MRLNPESLARASSRRPWRTVTVWIVVLVLGGYLASTLLAGALTTEFDFTDVPEAKKALLLVEEHLHGEEPWVELVAVHSQVDTVDDPTFQATVESLVTAVRDLGPDTVTFVSDPFPSSDFDTVIFQVVVADLGLDEATDQAIAVRDLVSDADLPDGYRAEQFGFASSNRDFETLSEEALRRGEGFGIAIALVVLLVVIGTVVAAVLPLLLAIAAIIVALGATGLLGLQFQFSFFVTNMISMIGLAVGIDYALFIVARYREERVRGFDKLEAVGRTGATANRAVFFSGMTVVLALVGLFFMPNTIFRSLATGAILAVVFAVAASMTLLPAVLALLGDRVNKLRVRRQGSLDNVDKIGGFWDRLTNTVMSRPVPWLLGGVSFMVVLALSFFSLETGFSGVDTLPDSVPTKQGFLLLESEGFGLPQPVQVVVDGPIDQQVMDDIAELQAAIASDARFGPFDPATAVEVSDEGDLLLLQIPLSSDVQSESSTAAVRELREDVIPQVFTGDSVEVLVGGFTAFNLDFFEDVSTYTPWVFLFVLGLSFMLLTVVFRSLVVPLKAILLNLLSVGAAYGMVVLFFQNGAGPGWVKDIASWLGFIQVEHIEAWLPLFLFAVLFGLSMDYHVFLLSRIREAFDRTGSNREAVAHGLRTTGSIITGAALIMVAVFGGFAAGDLVPLQQMGFGLAVAVFLDATVIRSILVPASMRLLGSLNWYLPGWLQWLPHIDIEGHEAAAAAAHRDVPHDG